ncbi:hypothetical protein ACFYSJ_04900 [Streptomyces sp. NPDC005248]|uniref:hypothetical protein n=1 Tax=Streptomyces sp. NPDC005248 TaxID=3364709 RepID=UPI003694F4B1
MQLQTPDEVRDFLRLCLDPGLGRKNRSVTQLALIMPDWLAAPLTEHAPHLAELRNAVDRAEAAATEARAAYTEGLRAWIADETTDRKDCG